MPKVVPASDRPLGDFSIRDIAQVRQKLGTLWGLGRDVTHAELARALGLSPKFGGTHLSRLERDIGGMSGAMETAMIALMDNWRPPWFASVVKPGYPRIAAK